MSLALVLAAPFSVAEAETMPGLFLGDEGASANAADSGLQARGVIDAASEAILSGEISARITAIPYREGMRFRQGAILVEFDCSLFEARLEQALAQVQAAQTRLATVERLQSMNSAGEQDVLLARAELRRVAGGASEAEALTARCRVTAPFDGYVVERFANAGEVATAGGRLISIVSASVGELRLLVPSGWLAWLEPGKPFRFAVDETGDVIESRVKRMGARIDPVSQRIPVYADLIDGEAAGGLTPGMSGTAIFSLPGG